MLDKIEEHMDPSSLPSRVRSEHSAPDAPERQAVDERLSDSALVDLHPEVARLIAPEPHVDPPVRPFPEPKEGRYYVEVYVAKNGLVVARMTMRSLSGDRLFCRERRNGGGASWL